MHASQEPRIWAVCLVVLGVYMSTEAAQDFARYKPTSMSSAFNSSHISSKAVDGDKDTYILTEFNQNYAWWRLDLQEYVTSPKIKIYFRIKYWFPNTWNELQMYTSKQYIPSPDSEVWSPPSGVENRWNWTVDNNHISQSSIFKGEIRYLLIYTTTNVSGRGAVLDFKEVEVWACPEGFYDKDCSKACSSRKCNGTSICPYDHGTCENGCRSNQRLHDCTECLWPYYGADCEKSCYDRGCWGFASDCSKTGTCTLGCKSNFTGSDCSECKAGLFGERCNFLCSERGCEGASSCPRNGTCDNGCMSGFTGQSCSECLPGLYGPDCSQNCSARNCEDDSPCSRHSFSCSCKSGWIGDGCTEACGPNSYGKNCSKSCQDRNCAQRTSSCDAYEGRCSGGCEAGYEGADCTESCPPHMYGQNCSKLCLDRMCVYPTNTCDGKTGKCLDGCKTGWKGVDCTINCPEGEKVCTTSSACPLEMGLLISFFLFWSTYI